MPTQQNQNGQAGKELTNGAKEESKISNSTSSQQQEFQYREHKTLSHLRLMALTNDGPQIYTLDCSQSPQEPEKLQKEEGYPQYCAAEIALFSPVNGSMLATVDFEGIHIVDMD